MAGTSTGSSIIEATRSGSFPYTPATRLDVLGRDDREHSPALTAVLVPDSCDADRLRTLILERFDMSLGAGLGQLAGRVFRIGHLGDLNDLMLAGTLPGVEMGLGLTGIPFTPGGVLAGLQRLSIGAGESAPVCAGDR